MFEIKDNAGHIQLNGRFDASQADKARAIFGQLTDSAIVDFSRLEYISSAGLGILLGAQKRLVESGKGLKLTNMSQHIREIFRIAGFDRIFEIE
ncbi:MAG: STAS domain-containing protein [Candidatus Krumholzibacteria bacterium]|nr:STAS domain-containing protein [Candidatus Krumholzibacteria bacterium]